MTYRILMPALAAALLAPVAARAHPGNHGALSAQDMIGHVSASAFHMAGYAAAVIAALAVIAHRRRVRLSRQEADRKRRPDA